MFTLVDYADLSKIITGVATVFILGVSATIGIFLYRWQRQSSKIDAIRKIHEDLRHYNHMVLENDDLQELEAKNHRWGNITKEDVVKMYRFFILFNISYSAYEAGKIKAIRNRVYDALLNNLANTTYDEREFIKQHVFPRGYENEFRKCVLELWSEIDKKGTLSNT